MATSTPTTPPATTIDGQFLLPIAQSLGLAGISLGENETSAEPDLDRGASGSRACLTDQEKLLLVRLCVLHGEEYLGPKEVFWANRTAEVSLKTGKRIGNARTIITELLRKFKAEVAIVS